MSLFSSNGNNINDIYTWKSQIITFGFNLNNVKNFKRINGHAHDCQINVLESLGLITSQYAGTMRQNIKNNKYDLAASTQGLYNFFKRKRGQYEYEFMHYANNYNDLVIKLIKDLPKSKACIVKCHNHIFAVCKDNDGKIGFIDAQIKNLNAQSNNSTILLDANSYDARNFYSGYKWFRVLNIKEMNGYKSIY